MAAVTAARSSSSNATASPASAQRPGSAQFPGQNHSQILRILRGYKRIAIVGLSNNPNRPSYFAATYLKDYGYEIIPVNPSYPEVMGFKSYPNLDAVVAAGIPLEVVDIFRKSGEVPKIVEDAIRLGAKVIWMQLGVINEPARDAAQAAGLDVVMDRCMKIEHARFHGGLNFAGIRTNLISSRKPRIHLLP
jgi:predicted CoA-binding protein